MHSIAIDSVDPFIRPHHRSAFQHKLPGGIGFFP